MKFSEWTALTNGIQVSDVVTENDFRITKRIEFSTFSLITANLYLTSLAGITAINLEKYRIEQIFDFAKEFEYKIDSIAHKKFNFEDSKSSDLLSAFDNVSDEIKSLTSHGHNVVVHCFSGVSRSAAMALAYLMKYERLSLKNAFYKIAEKRAIVRPNNSFFEQLIEYEKRLFGNSSVTMIETTLHGKCVTIPDFFEKDDKLIANEFKE
ncbi:dual specificity protein phosphatase 14-like protein, partial [Leptotrombidium deliense]